MNDRWKELYQEALLELCPQELQRRIAVAEKAIQERIAELRRDDSCFEEELRRLDDSLRGLRVLASLECQALASHDIHPAQSKATP